MSGARSFYPDAARADAGRAHRWIRAAEGWTSVSDPTEFARMLDTDHASLVALLDEVRQDERRRLSKLFSSEANRVFNKQERDYPSNILDRVSAWLQIGDGGPSFDVSKEPYK